MTCPQCAETFELKPWPTVKMKYCSKDCMRRAWYERNRERVNAKTKQWCKDHRELRLEVQRRWNAKSRSKELKRVWQLSNYKAWYAKMKAAGGVKFINARGTSRRRLISHRPERQCVCRGEHGGRIECHHKDGNPFNTALENLEWRCHRHHRLWHGRYRHPAPALGVRGSLRAASQTTDRKAE